MTAPVVPFGLTIKPARNFVTMDILRRILADYFGYKLEFVMNITDIDELVHSRTPFL
jgi:cysteinyl-tRNA synthetase